ncbi:hypothetical protein WBN73_01810 [Paenarthrobacter sp. CCNWLY172]|uniref:Uncharacterized protein n=1 Tax=Paenarthrobacter sp. AMU7 TaxID=3162492 RepID=A0AB39YL65_9MICC|nr:hypothetical protein [Paenarthrobacter sp. OM7]WGM19369.1 hypothetical protein QEH68_15235 [Paenarthrobacter sp. OM7]
MKVVHEPGIIAGKAGPTLFAALRRGTAAAGNMRAVPRTVDLGMAQAPQTGDNAQAQG